MGIYHKIIHSHFIRLISILIPDNIYLRIKYRLLTGQTLHLNKPVTFNEKIQWLKIHDRNPLYCKLVDKYTVKSVLSDWIGEGYIIPTIECWERIEDICFDKLPEKFVLKTTHDSGGVVICKDKNKLDINEVKKKIRNSYKRNYYWHGREWPYKDLQPRVIAEPYLVDESGYELKDYKVFCFSGIPQYIQVDYDRFTDHHRNFYSTKWEYVPFTTLYPTNSERMIDKPKVLEELLAICKIIGSKMGNPPFVRLDFYIINEKIYFGEITLYHGSGTEKFTPESYNVKLGSMIRCDWEKVTFVIGLLLQGGAERVIANLSSAMADQGKDVVILSYYNVTPAYQLHPKVKLIKIEEKTKTKNVFKNIIYMRQFFRERGGTIFSFLAVFNMMSIIAHLGLSSKLIVADRNDPNHVPSSRIIRWGRNMLYNFADLIVVQTRTNGEYFKKRGHAPVKVIYNPLELNEKAGKALRTEKRDIIVSVGRLMPQKNQAMLIRAFCKVHKVFPEYKLVIYGEGDSRKDLENLIDKLGLSRYIDLPGNIIDIFDKILPAKLFVLSSYYEGMPNVLIEAMGLGLPVISTKVSGAVDLIRDGINGELVDVGDEITLADRMIAILKNKNLQRKYGENAVEITDNLNSERITKEWLAL